MLRGRAGGPPPLPLVRRRRGGGPHRARGAAAVHHPARAVAADAAARTRDRRADPRPHAVRRRADRGRRASCSTRARVALEAAEDALAVGRLEEPRGPLAVGLPLAGGQERWFGLVQAYSQRYPAVEVRPRQAMTEQLQDQLLAGELDCAMGFAPARRSGLTYTHVVDETLSITMHRDASARRPRADRRSPTSKACRSRCVGGSGAERSGYNVAVRDLFADAGVRPDFVLTDEALPGARRPLAGLPRHQPAQRLPARAWCRCRWCRRAGCRSSSSRAPGAAAPRYARSRRSPPRTSRTHARSASPRRDRHWIARMARPYASRHGRDHRLHPRRLAGVEQLGALRHVLRRARLRDATPEWPRKAPDVAAQREDAGGPRRPGRRGDRRALRRDHRRRSTSRRSSSGTRSAG